MSSKQASSLSGLQHAIAGGFAGACEVLGTMPLNTVKTQMQIHPHRYTSWIDATRKICFAPSLDSPSSALQLTRPRIDRLYYGMPPLLMGVVCKVAVRFSLFQHFEQQLQQRFVVLQDRVHLARMTAALGAGSVEAAVIHTPMDRLKTLRQNEIGHSIESQRYKGWQGVRLVLHDQGVSGLFKGFSACWLRQATSVPVRFLVFYGMKDRLQQVEQSAWRTPFLESLLCGGVAGGVSTLINNPIDVMKSRIQAQNTSRHVQAKYSGFADCVRKSLAAEGSAVLWHGLVPRMLRIVPGQAISFAAYEFICRQMQQHSTS
mmetsp:Transcript_1446/g.4514  ORF Transcript_1446/g.4514 Transcript_1446/m.4514 type:complete len:317 (-) Transcript_1446:356-1306(-)